MSYSRAMKRTAAPSVLESGDFHPTHPSATQTLIRLVKFKGQILEPACGDGAISKLLIKAGYSVESSDLYDRGYGKSGNDFLRYRGPKIPNIITNPPFGNKGTEKFIRQSLRFATKKVAIFCRLVWIGASQPRHELMKELCPSLIIVLGRVPMGKKQRKMVDYCWLVFDQDDDSGTTKVVWP